MTRACLWILLLTFAAWACERRRVDGETPAARPTVVGCFYGETFYFQWSCSSYAEPLVTPGVP